MNVVNRIGRDRCASYLSASYGVFSTKEEGLGIGLLLANTALERLGGQVSLLSDPQGGTCTRINLPARIDTAA